MTEILRQWVAFVRHDLRESLEASERVLRDRLDAQARVSGPLAEELTNGRIAAAERRCAELETERLALAEAVATRRDAYLAAVTAAFTEAEAALPAYEAALARDDLAAAAEALDTRLDAYSPAQLAAVFDGFGDQIDELRGVVRRRFAAAAAILADDTLRDGGLERARERHAAAQAGAAGRWHQLIAGGHAVSDVVRAATEAMTLSQLQDLTAFLDQALADAEIECSLAPQANVFEELDAWR